MNAKNLATRRMLLVFFLCVIMVGCSDPVDDETSGTSADEESVVISYTIADALETKVTSHEVETDYTYDQETVIDVALNEDAIVVTPATGTVSGSIFTITSTGTYRIHGSLVDGGIVVDADDQVVQLIFDGVEIKNSTTSPVNVVAAEKTIILLSDGTVNKISDAPAYVFAADEDEPNAAIFSKSDLTIGGSGELKVNGNYEDAIRSKDGLIIHSGDITVTAADDGVIGKDYAIIQGGTLSITATGDGIKSDNDDSTDVGYVLIEGGSVTVNAKGDGINAETDLLVADGTFSVITGGGSNYTVSGDNSSKGLKAGANLIVEGGNFTISSADDAMHSNSNLAISAGTFLISSGDDGIHADANIGVNGGVISITKSYEGIESANISISDGEIRLVSSDDGLNGAGGNDGSGFGGPNGGYSSSSDYFIYLNGGYVYVDAKGDGIDVNGSIVMTGGTVIVNGPTTNSNGAIDYDQTFKITGGTLLAVGSSGMAQQPGSTSTQRSVLVTLSSSKSAGTLVHLENESGIDFFTFKPSKQYQTVVFSSPELEKGTYNLFTGGSSSGISTDGLYEDGGEYSGGSSAATFAVSNIVTSVR